MPEAKIILTTPNRAARRPRTAPALPSNVVALPKRYTGTEAIVADVMGRKQREDAVMLQKLHELTIVLDARHRKRCNKLLPIALRMDRPMLDDLIEIGRRMLSERVGAC